VLVLWQWLGLVHRAAHADAAPHGSPAFHAAVGEAGGQPAPHWTARLFDSHQQDSPDCQLLDQLAHADGAPALFALALSLQTPGFVARFPAGLATAGCAAPFDARAPPAIR